MTRRPRARFACYFVLNAGCGGTLDAGSDGPEGLLPVDARNPVILCNDGPYDNWQGEYAVLLSNAGGPEVAGIVVNASAAWPELDSNLIGWQALVQAARDSGLQDVPDPLPSVSELLQRPDDGSIEATLPNDSEGARFIVDVSLRSSQPDRPVVVVTGGRLTDVADAYLIDPTLPERVVVVSSLGTADAEGGRMGVPNGEMDPWADTIVVEKFRYVQVSAYYDQLADVPAARLPELPDNALGGWIASKQPGILDLREAADQVGIIALGVAEFARSVTRVSAAGSVALPLGEAPLLSANPSGQAWLVTESDATLASAQFWRLVLDPVTYEQ